MLLAQLDTLITIAIFLVIAIISSWLKKKQAPEDEAWPGQSSGPQQGPARPRPKPSSWEEELRKLLEGDEPAPPPRPPPVIVHEKPRPAGPPPVMPRPIPTPRPLPAARPAPLVAQDEQDIGLPVRLPSLTQSSEAYQRASQIDLQVAERLRQIGQQVTRHTGAQKAEVVSTDILLGKAMLRERTSLRGAIVASVILGPPKAFEP